MSPDGLTLEVVTPDGLPVQEHGLDVVVLHRREARFDVEEIAVFPSIAAAGPARGTGRVSPRGERCIWPWPATAESSGIGCGS
jgi:hypothetical protein